MEDVKQAVTFVKLLAGFIVGILWAFLHFLGRKGRVASLIVYLALSAILDLRASKIAGKNTYLRGFLHYFVAFAFARTLTFTLLL